MRVEANVTSGLHASDASALELVPILQAEIQKLRELLQLQQMEQQERFKPGLLPSAAMQSPSIGSSTHSRRNSFGGLMNNSSPGE